jgi:hypothetical protein
MDSGGTTPLGGRNFRDPVVWCLLAASLLCAALITSLWKTPIRGLLARTFKLNKWMFVRQGSRYKENPRCGYSEEECVARLCHQGEFFMIG